MEKKQTLKLFHITINKKQLKSISTLGDLEFIGSIKPLNIKIHHFKIYKDNKRVRLSLAYTSLHDLIRFFYLAGLHKKFDLPNE